MINTDRRDRDPRDSRRRDERERRDAGRRDGDKNRDRHDRDKEESEKGGRDAEREPEPEEDGERNARTDSEPRETRKPSQPQGVCVCVSPFLSLTVRQCHLSKCFIATPAFQKVIQPQIDEGEAEEGETMDALNDEDEAMMAMMGMTGFGSTKVLTSMSLPCCSHSNPPF